MSGWRLDEKPRTSAFKVAIGPEAAGLYAANRPCFGNSYDLGRLIFPMAREGGGDFSTQKDLPVTTDQTISIDGVDYAIDSLSENTKAQLISLQAVDRRIATAQEELAILQTARIAYSNVVKQELQAK